MMFSYLIKRIFLIVPTMFGILVLNFSIVQMAPGGPVERMLIQLQGVYLDPLTLFSGVSQASPQENQSQAVDPALVQALKKQYGFDQPAHVRFMKMIQQYLVFDLGQSYFKGRSVSTLILEKLPTSLTLSLLSSLIIYMISLPLGVRKAVRHGTPFDFWTSMTVIIGYAFPAFLLGIILIVFFAGGSFFKIFPLRGLTSLDWASLTLWQKMIDYLWHLFLPLFALTVSGFAHITLLTKNNVLDEMKKAYVTTARAKGTTEKHILYGHIFANATLSIITGFPTKLLHNLFAGTLLIEVIFSLDGLGLLGFEAAVGKDYPVMFGLLYLMMLISLLLHLVRDILYVIIDPRIHFDKQVS